MHEIDVCAAIHDAVMRRAQGRPVARIDVRAGVLHHLTPEAVSMGFAMVAAGGPAQSAEVQLTTIPARLSCSDCEGQSEVTDLYATCPRCGSTDVEVTAGEDLLLEWIEYREPVEGETRHA